jgi:hypothetical protein
MTSMTNRQAPTPATELISEELTPEEPDRGAHAR